LYFKEHIDEFLYYTHNYNYTTVAQVSSNVLDELASLFKIETSALDTKIIAAGLRKIGVDYVVTDEFAETKAANAGAKALDERLKIGYTVLIITDSFAATKFTERNFPELAKIVLNYPSAQQEFGKFVKTVFAAEKNIDPNKIRTITITSDNENSAEALENGSVNYSMNARELYRMFLRTGVNPRTIRPTDFDSFGPVESFPTQFGKLFAPVTWEVGKNAEELDQSVCGTAVKVAVAKNLGQVRELLTEVKNGTTPYKVIRINS